jgi:hypothetical protein
VATLLTSELKLPAIFESADPRIAGMASSTRMFTHQHRPSRRNQLAVLMQLDKNKGQD